MQANNKFMKNDRVEFDVKDRTVYGIVTEEGDRLSVIADGGEMRYGIPAGRLRFSNKSIRRDKPNAMDVWQVTGFREETNDIGDGLSFSAVITKHGVPVLSASNSGHGAPDRYAPLNGDYAVMQDFSLSVREWLAELDVAEGEIFEEENFWIMYRARHAPYGVLAATAVEAYFAEPALPLTEVVEPEAQQPIVNNF